MGVADMGDRWPATRRSSAAASSCARRARRRGSSPCRHRAPAAKAAVSALAMARRRPVGAFIAGFLSGRRGVGERIDRREIGLDVDDRRAVEHVDGVEFDHARFRCRRATMPGDMQADRVRASRGAQGENAFRFSGMARFLDNQIPRRLVQPGQDEDVAGPSRPAGLAVGRVDQQRCALARFHGLRSCSWGSPRAVVHGERMRPMKTMWASPAHGCRIDAPSLFAVARSNIGSRPSAGVRRAPFSLPAHATLARLAMAADLLRK